MLSPVKATATNTCDKIDFEKKEVFTLTEVVATIRGLKSGKTAGEDKIGPEMLSALNERVLSLTRVCELAWKLGKTPKGWHSGVIISTYKAIVKSVQIIDEYHFLAFREKFMPSTLKRNAEK